MYVTLDSKTDYGVEARRKYWLLHAMWAVWQLQNVSFIIVQTEYDGSTPDTYREKKAKKKKDEKKNGNSFHAILNTHVS